MQMRQQDGVRRGQGLAERDQPSQMRDLPAQQRIRHELDAVQLDQRGCVPDVEDRRHVTPILAATAGGCVIPMGRVSGAGSSQPDDEAEPFGGNAALRRQAISREGGKAK